ncbi:hypothetical protein IFM61606_00320 [Aspergillus udagawae]|uniref:Uncharacterized protein n=1 Tax=Aspergillus udagawae TaxID=91492 RepID=A0ABQ1AX42_9EURO|nr:hypothetical protein IFM51744_03512 [Aspergillus udagawae]GFF88149.1 hypothetical protein IFM53868_05396 [Aspergillus udagawae]GFG06056.1 hypothetical protein IFM5058_02736 [Aspergillus udagawae]GFG20071.1 hypothetical protein IFM61606_00320 [Aspergillus udagawae]
MQPNHYDLLGQAQQDDCRPGPRMTREAHQPLREHILQSRSPSGAALTRSEDSWIEVSSQPSSSSLSSAATNDDIITTGLRVERTESRSYHHRSRRRRLQQLAAVATPHIDYPLRETSSSQDEYDESESESDHVLSSSNEDMACAPAVEMPLLSRTDPALPEPEATIASDEDDASTALGMRISSSPFVPQPNVFSHPPENPSWTRATGTQGTHQSQPSTVSNSSRQTAIRRNSQASVRSNRRPQHSPYNMISPSYHADHDAALRASLSTLLSCAAAARGLPKSDPQPSPAEPARGSPSSFRLVSESVAMGEVEVSEKEEQSATETTSTRSHRPSKRHADATPYTHRTKRRSSLSKERNTGHPSVAKKSRRAGMAESMSTGSPTIMTWVISAGVVVLFSAISFSAGYVLGREVGRLESSTGVGSVMGDGGAGVLGGRASASCGQEAVRGGLKRLRWGTGSGASGIIA